MLKKRGPRKVLLAGTTDGARHGLGEVGDLGGREVINARANAVVGGYQAADVARTRIVGPRVGGARTGGAAGTDGERRAALPNPEAAEIPSTQQRVGPLWHVTAEHVAFADGQSVLRGHRKRLRNVEVGAARDRALR